MKNTTSTIFLLSAFLFGCSTNETKTHEKNIDFSFRTDTKSDTGEIQDQSQTSDIGSGKFLLPKVLEDASSIALVTAHPDDEFYTSPLLGELCKTKQCILITLTQGEAGNCGLTLGCSPSLAEVRKIELQVSATHLNMKLEHWNLGDGKRSTIDGVLEHWAAGDAEALVKRLAAVLTTNDVDVAFAFDPRHGTSCHADHRASGVLLIEAAKEAQIDDSHLFLIENAIWAVCEQQTPIALGFQAAVLDDANIEINVETSWGTIGEILAIHQSQFEEGSADLIEMAPPEKRHIFLQTLAEVDSADMRYEGICPELQNVCQ